MNTTENNKKIAEFMSWNSNESKTVYYEPTDEVQGIGGFDIENLPFDNWNWLMQVVEKIEDLNFSFEINKQEENDYQCLIVNKNDIKVQKFNVNKIEAVYNACIEFIDWYNKNSEVDNEQ